MRENRTISNNNKINQKDKILVVMPTYNRPEKCLKVVNNIVKQTYKNWNLLIIDDGSSADNFVKLERGLIDINNNNVFFIFSI